MNLIQNSNRARAYYESIISRNAISGYTKYIYVSKEGCLEIETPDQSDQNRYVFECKMSNENVSVKLVG
jgi:hypothetical protein